MSAIQTNICTRITELLDVLAASDAIVNGHLASFFAKNLWANALPSVIIKELENFEDLNKFAPLYFTFLADIDRECLKTYPNLERFLRIPRNLSTVGNDAPITQLNQLNSKLSEFEAPPVTAPKLTDFMSAKKKHEVEKMVPLIEMLAKMTATSHVVDVGGGKGYLSAILAKHCGLRVLALDSSSITTCGAEKLEKKMDKSSGKSSINSHKFQRETILVNSDTNLKPVLIRNFGSGSINVGLVGLHTCGNLATACLSQFVRNDIQWIVNIGCCYHHIDEEFEDGEFWRDMNCSNEIGFPMSEFLKVKKVKLGRNARMMSAHCLEKMLLSGINQETSKSLFYRAVLQVILERARGHDLQEGRIGRLARKCNNFNQYVRRATQILQLDINLSDEEIEDMFKTYSYQEVKLQIFFLLRTHFAPAVEAVILLDRLLFLHEQGIEDAYLVPLFDPTLSPRSHAIVAWKSATG